MLTFELDAEEIVTACVFYVNAQLRERNAASAPGTGPTVDDGEVRKSGADVIVRVWKEPKP